MTAETEKKQIGQVLFEPKEGAGVQGTLLRLTPHAAAFELYSPDTVLHASEALEEFKIFIEQIPVYSGRAVVRGLVNAGTALIASVDLDGFSFDTSFFEPLGETAKLRERFEALLNNWQAVCKVLPDFKVAVADIQTFLIDLRRWTEQIELAISSSSKPDRVARERTAINELAPVVLPVIDSLFEKFEKLAEALDEEARPVHRSYIQRLLHPVVLCAPFAYRSYRKPLGYAGDYEVINMMLRDPQEGASLFAKLFNVWLLHQGSAEAHRNRIRLLKQCLIHEVAAAVRAKGRARILSLGCGSAKEVQDFVAESELSNHATFTLLDFNEETLQHLSQVLREQQRLHHRTASIHLAKGSVQQLLKDMARGEGLSKGERFDFVYCAGLFDYFPDRMCKRLMTLFYESLGRGGVALSTNVAPFSPNRGSLELILDWHLIYRDARGVAKLTPDNVRPEDVRIFADDTGINVFLEVRRGHVR